MISTAPAAPTGRHNIPEYTPLVIAAPDAPTLEYDYPLSRSWGGSMLVSYDDDKSDLNFIPKNLKFETVFYPEEYKNQELRNMTDWVNAEYDPEAKARVEKVYGKYTSGLDFAVGSKIARTEGFFDYPELWFYHHKKPIPKVNSRVDLYGAIAREFRADAKKEWETQQEAKKILNMLDLSLTGWDHSECRVRQEVIKGEDLPEPQVLKYLYTGASPNLSDGYGYFRFLHVSRGEPIPAARELSGKNAETLYASVKKQYPKAYHDSYRTINTTRFMPWPETLKEYKKVRAENLARLRRMNEEDKLARQKAIIEKQEAEEAAKIAQIVDFGFPAFVVLLVLVQAWRAARRGVFGDWRTWFAFPACAMLAFAAWASVYKLRIARDYWFSPIIFDVPQEFFGVLRWSVTVSAALLAWRAISRKEAPLAIVLPVAIVMLFQPIFSPIHFDRVVWIWVDIAAFVILLCLAARKKKQA